MHRLRIPGKHLRRSQPRYQPSHGGSLEYPRVQVDLDGLPQGRATDRHAEAEDFCYVQTTGYSTDCHIETRRNSDWRAKTVQTDRSC